MSIQYTICLLLGIICGSIIAKKLHMPKPNKKTCSDIYIILAIGLIIGAKIPIWLSYGLDSALVLSNKSVMGALLGAFISVNIYKYILHQKDKSYGGIFIIPLAVAIGFGKIGCYLNGCCSGHFFIPVQLMECAFQFIMASVLYVIYKKTQNISILFPAYMVAYLIMRFIVEFVRVEPKIWVNLTIYQILSLIFIPIFVYILRSRYHVGTNKDIF